MNIYYISLRNQHVRQAAKEELIDELGDWWELHFSANEIRDPVWCARQIPRIKKEIAANRKNTRAELDENVRGMTPGDYAEAYSMLIWQLEEEGA